VLFLVSASLLLLAAFLVFRRSVRRDYLTYGRLTPLSSILQLLLFGAYFCFPYLYNPPEWSWFWMLDGPSGHPMMITGLVLISLGFVLAFGAMFWFGIRRAFGLEVTGLIRSGPYRHSRNPQVLGGYPLVIGSVVQWPSWYALGWVILYAVICHMMIRTEEEHLAAQFGDEYRRFCREVPRYFWNIDKG
jgi:protein-S-isoprenylcysteine O-methyltransferase Ste14